MIENPVCDAYAYTRVATMGYTGNGMGAKTRCRTARVSWIALKPGA